MTTAFESLKSTGPESIEAETCASAASTTSNGLTLSAEASPVRTFPLPVHESESAASEADSGQSSIESFAKLDPDSSSWRTYQACLIAGWEESLETFPEAGSMQSGRLYRRARWVRHSCGEGCSLWPSPRASDRDNCGGSNARCKAQRTGTYIGRNQNPEFQGWLMGFPFGWSDLQPEEIQSSHKQQSGSDND